jgi:hypothetical protein
MNRVYSFSHEASPIVGVAPFRFRPVALIVADRLRRGTLPFAAGVAHFLVGSFRDNLLT